MKTPSDTPEDRGAEERGQDHSQSLFGWKTSFLTTWTDKAVGRLESGIVAGLLGLLVLIVSPFLFLVTARPL
jgi:hypothetical protein